MKKLSKREKTLIYIMVSVIITMACVYFLIIPEKNKFDDNSEIIGMLEMDKQSMQIEVSGYEKRLADYEKISSEAELAKETFYKKMVYDDIDLMVTSLMVKYSLKKESLFMADVGEEDVLADTAQNDSEQSSQDSQSEIIYSVNARIEADGDIENMKSMIDEISNNSKLVLLSYDIKSSVTDATEDTPSTTSYSIIMEIEFNMLNET